MLLKENIPVSYIFGKIKYEMLAVSIYAVMVEVMYQNFHFTRISIPIAVPTIVGTVLSLLLAFRSNQAYDRWWEARMLWGAIVNDSRTLTRQILTFVDHPYDPIEAQFFKEKFVKRQIAWCYSLGQSLRKLNPLAGTEKLMTKSEIDFISKYTNKPNSILELHGMDLKKLYKEGWVNEYQQIQIDRTLSGLCDSMGACERIKNTVFPATYSLYIHFSLHLFILLLPFGLIEYFGIMEIPLLIAIASSFYLIEKMAIHLQDPFENKPTDTPVTAIAQTIDRDLRQMLKDSQFSEEQIQVNHVQKEASVYYIL